MSEEEHAKLKERAARQHMRAGTYMRTAALKSLPPTIPEINREALNQLQRIGGNLNQLARHANTNNGDLDLSDLRKLIAALRLALMESQP